MCLPVTPGEVRAEFTCTGQQQVVGSRAPLTTYDRDGEMMGMGRAF